MHSIEYTKKALKVLAKMPPDLRALVERKIEEVRLQGRLEFRLRVHDWRVIYRVLDDRVVMLVVKIGTRGQVYEE